MDRLKIEVSRMYRLNGDSSTKAFCDLSVGEFMVIKGLRIVQGKNGLFVSMPREQGRDGKWYSRAYPLSKEALQKISEVVLSAYEV
jgi:stage V sporulation protein G